MASCNLCNRAEAFTRWGRTPVLQPTSTSANSVAQRGGRADLEVCPQSQCGQDLRGVAGRLDLREDLLDLTPLVDHEGGALDPHHFLAVHVLLLPHAVSLRDFLIDVAQQRIWKALVLLEGSLCLGRVLGNAEHHHALLFKLLERVAKLARFYGAARSTGFRIEEEHRLLAAYSVQIERFARIGL